MGIRVFFLCFIYSSFWIISTDYLVNEFVSQDLQHFIQTTKGLFYIVSSSILISWFVQKEQNIINPNNKHKLNHFILMLSLTYCTLWILITDYIVYEFVSHDYWYLSETIKGLVFVLSVSIVLGWFAQRELNLSKKVFPLIKNSQVGLFANMIVHEVKNPLAIINFQASLIKIRSNEQEIQKSCKKIEKYIESLVQTVNFFHKLGQGVSEDPGQFNEEIYIKDSINEIVEFYPFEEESILFDNNIPDNLVVIGSKGLVSHLFINLFKNAYEYLLEQDLNSKYIKVSSDIKDDCLEIFVENSGKQIPKEEQENIFSVYTTKGDKGGMGFGLVISQKIMQAHDGKILYDHQFDHPRFKLIFPKYKYIE